MAFSVTEGFVAHRALEVAGTPLAPWGIVKSKMASCGDPTLVTTACVPGLPVVTLPTDSVAAVPVSPLGPVGPVGPVAPVRPVGPVEPVGPVGPVAPVRPVGPVGAIILGKRLEPLEIKENGKIISITLRKSPSEEKSSGGIFMRKYTYGKYQHTQPFILPLLLWL